jgi:hypothetical protein
LSEESSESSANSDREENLFMTIETKIDEDKEIMGLEEEENDGTYGEVDCWRSPSGHTCTRIVLINAREF